MAWQDGVAVFAMVAAGAVSLAVAQFLAHRRRVPGSWPLVAINVAGTLWAWAAAGELASATLANAAFFHNLSFLAMSNIGVLWLIFAAEYTGHDRYATWRRVGALFVIPLVTQILVWTNSFHHLMFTSLTMVERGSHWFLEKDPGLWWWVDTVYTYALLAVGLVLLLVVFLRSAELYRRQIAALVGAVVVPAVADIIFIRGLEQQQAGINWAPALFVWVGLVLYWGFMRYRLLELVPLPREMVTEQLAAALVVIDTENRITYINQKAARVFQTDSSVVLGRSFDEVAENLSGLAYAYRQALRWGSDEPTEWEYQSRCYFCRASSVIDKRGRTRGHVLTFADVTERKAAELALEESRQQLERRVAERTAQLATEKERLVRLNEFAQAIAGCTSTAEVAAIAVDMAGNVVGADSGAVWLRSGRGTMRLMSGGHLAKSAELALQHLLQTSPEVDAALAEGSAWCLSLPDELPGGVRSAEAPGLRAGEQLFWQFKRLLVVPLVSRTVNLGALCLLSGDLHFGSDQGILALASAIASETAISLENARRYEDAQFLAEHDSLTRLLNHRGFSRHLEEELARSETEGGVFGLVMIDIDNFKRFNDVYGYSVGDLVLQEVSRVLVHSLRHRDLTARVGGDEFMVVLPEADAQVTRQLVERIRSSLEETPVLVAKGSAVPVRLSCGIAVYPRDGHTSAELLASVDANLSRSKHRGGDLVTSSLEIESYLGEEMRAFGVLDGLVTTVGNKDRYTRRHSDEVTEYASDVAARMGLSPEMSRALRVAGLLHDVGKLGVPDSILAKPGDLTPEEFEVVKQHVALGELITQGIPDQELVVSAIGAHHEHWDGSGYPRGLKGEEIPLLGRILAVADAYSAMTSHRPYRKALAPEEAKAELKRVAGSQLDPQVVEIFLHILEEPQTGPSPIVWAGQ